METKFQYCHKIQVTNFIGVLNCHQLSQSTNYGQRIQIDITSTKVYPKSGN